MSLVLEEKKVEIPDVKRPVRAPGNGLFVFHRCLADPKTGLPARYFSLPSPEGSNNG